MKLLALLIGIYAERYLARWSHLREFRPLEEQANQLAQRLLRLDKRAAPFIVAGIVLACAVPVGIVAWLLRDDWSVGWFLFAVVVLLFSFGPRDLKAEALAFHDKADAGDKEGARAQAEVILGGEAPDKPKEQAAAVEEATYREANNRIFGVIFWFLAAGPLGPAFRIRLSCAEQRAALHGHAARRRRSAPRCGSPAWPARLDSGPHHLRELRPCRQFRRRSERLAQHSGGSAAEPVRGLGRGAQRCRRAGAGRPTGPGARRRSAGGAQPALGLGPHSSRSSNPRRHLLTRWILLGIGVSNNFRCRQLP